MSRRFMGLGAALALALALVPAAALAASGPGGGGGGGGGGLPPGLVAAPCATLTVTPGAEFIEYGSNTPLVLNAELTSCSSLVQTVTVSYEEIAGLERFCGLAPWSTVPVTLKPGERRGVSSQQQIPLTPTCFLRFYVLGTALDDAGTTLATATTSFDIFTPRRGFP